MSDLTKACGRVVITIHYSIILPKILYNLNISLANQREDADINIGNLTEHVQYQIITIMGKTGSLLNGMRADDHKQVFN